MKNLEIRMDDVLQTMEFSQLQIKMLRDKTMFERFLEIDKEFEKYNYPCILAILAEGIDNAPEWLEHIKKNQHRYIIELHGSAHIRYDNLTQQELLDDLYSAKTKIEKEFGVKVSTWYVPFGRKGRNKYAEEVCLLLGIKLGIPESKIDAKFWFRNKNLPQINFHYWVDAQNNHVKNILYEINKNTKTQ